MRTISGDSVEEAVAGAVAALRAATDQDWRVVNAGPVELSCLATAEHVLSDLIGYAGNLAGQAKDRYFPYKITLQTDAGPVDALEAIEAGGALLAAAVRTAPRGARGFHPYPFRSADREGFAAMGIAEVVLHAHDMATGLGVPYRPADGLCAEVLATIFPHVRPGDDAWQTLLWATGRAELPDRERLSSWRWYNNPVIRTDRLTLEGIRPSAAADLALGGGNGGFDWVADGPSQGTRDAAGALLKQYQEGTFRPEWGGFALVRSSDDRAVGGMGFHRVPDENGRVEIGYDLPESARGNGYATEALRALAEWARSRRDDVTVFGVVDPLNVASQRVLERAGFTRTATESDGDIRFELRPEG